MRSGVFFGLRWLFGCPRGTVLAYLPVPASVLHPTFLALWPLLLFRPIESLNMSSFNDLSSIVLIVGALFIIIFLIHGLWFSNKPQNRRLKKNDLRDQELSRSDQIGKVRIVTPDSMSTSDDEDLADLATIRKSSDRSHNLDAGTEKSSKLHRAQLPQDYDDGYNSSLQNNASISVNPQTHNRRTEPSFNVDELTPNAMGNAYDETNIASAASTAASAAATEQHDVYEIIIASDPERPYLGEDIEEICNQYGFIQGYIQEDLKIYFVYENAREKTNEVFRICSMEPPFYFPENMHGYQTSAIALYMTLPAQGKAFAYFKALRMATEIFINQLGGHMEDQHRRQLTAADLDELAAELQAYDNAAPVPQQQM